MAVLHQHAVPALKKRFKREILTAALELPCLIRVVVDIRPEEQLAHRFALGAWPQFESPFRFSEIPSQKPAHLRIDLALDKHFFDLYPDEIRVPNRADASR